MIRVKIHYKGSLLYVYLHPDLNLHNICLSGDLMIITDKLTKKEQNKLRLRAIDKYQRER